MVKKIKTNYYNLLLIIILNIFLYIKGDDSSVKENIDLLWNYEKDRSVIAENLLNKEKDFQNKNETQKKKSIETVSNDQKIFYEKVEKYLQPVNNNDIKKNTNVMYLLFPEATTKVLIHAISNDNIIVTSIEEAIELSKKIQPIKNNLEDIKYYCENFSSEEERNEYLAQYQTTKAAIKELRHGNGIEFNKKMNIGVSQKEAAGSPSDLHESENETEFLIRNEQLIKLKEELIENFKEEREKEKNIVIPHAEVKDTNQAIIKKMHEDIKLLQKENKRNKSYFLFGYLYISYLCYSQKNIKTIIHQSMKIKVLIYCKTN